jgi:DNA-cytosine methyltransferase
MPCCSPPPSSIAYFRTITNFNDYALADIDSTAAYTFKKNYPTIPYWISDLSSQEASRICQLTKLPSGELDLLIGGPPCQGFSSNGKRWIQDSRNGLLLHFIKLALEVKPKCILIENVPPVVFAFQKAFESEIENSFKGYDVQVKILNASAFGVPQIRKRAFIVAFREDLKVSELFFPKPTHIAIENGPDARKKSKELMAFTNVEDAISDLPSLRPGGKVDGEPYTLPPGSEYQRQRRKGSIAIFNHIARSHSKDFIKKLSIIKPEGATLISQMIRNSPRTTTVKLMDVFTRKALPSL